LSFWTPDREVEFKRLRLEEGLSHAEAAHRLGTTRASCCAHWSIMMSRGQTKPRLALRSFG
jgi:hypothetical protein